MLHFLTALSSEWNTITVHREANYPLSIKPSITDLLTAGNKSQTPLQIALKYMFIHWRKEESTAHMFMKFYSQKRLPFQDSFPCTSAWDFPLFWLLKACTFQMAFAFSLQWAYEIMLRQPGRFCPNVYLEWPFFCIGSLRKCRCWLNFAFAKAGNKECGKREENWICKLNSSLISALVDYKLSHLEGWDHKENLFLRWALFHLPALFPHALICPEGQDVLSLQLFAM